jgi:ABC-type polysaccharide/polyol phosphate transport system ATPase subunit
VDRVRRSASSPTIDAPPPATGRAAVDVEHLSVHFRIRVDSATLRGDLARLIRHRKPVERIVPALEDMSFSVPKGSVLAIIGRNGAGKTTLLRAIAGVLAPDAGRIVVRGQLNLLIPGAGFNAALTGRENITLGGLASGMSDTRIAEIAESVAEFAELGEYLDYPIRTYSSGMRSRLGFAVAAHLDPDVLLIDEALSAGDAGFAEKAGRKMAELCGHGRTILLVTHGLSSVRTMATDAMWMHQGRIVAHDTPEDVVARYMRWCRLENLDLLSDPFT